MAEILPFVPRLDGAGAERLAVTLSAAFAAGADLGPRGPQLRALGRSLDALAATARGHLTALEAALDGLGIASAGHPRVRALLAEVERCASLARSCGADGAPPDGSAIPASAAPRGVHRP